MSRGMQSNRGRESKHDHPFWAPRGDLLLICQPRRGLSHPAKLPAELQESRDERQREPHENSQKVMALHLFPSMPALPLA